MRKSAAQTVQSSFLAGVRDGQKEVRDGDYTGAAVALLVLAVAFVAGMYLLVRIFRMIAR